MKTPMNFADLYIEGKIYIPIPFDRASPFDQARVNIALLEGRYVATTDKKKTQSCKAQLEKEILKLVSSNKLNALSALKLNPLIEYKIYIALHELIQAMLISSKLLLKNDNKEMVEKRRKTIKYLEKILKYHIVSVKTHIVIEDELNKLKEYDKNRKTYHPIKEVDFYRVIHAPPPCTWNLMTNTISQEFPEIKNKEIEEFLYPPLSIKTGRPYNSFFFKSLLIIIYKYLREAKIPIEKAKHLTKNIITEYCKKKGYSDIIHPITYKRIDHAVHDC
ncbi:MAG: hypothetical protein C0415_06495 [Thermodesulfovibrio sp.]|nr:hypothetical protein [Thermodesulfovibrio sp.]